MKKLRIKLEKQLHNGYIEYVNAKKRGVNIPQYFGKYHYVYSLGKNEISLIKLMNLLDLRPRVFGRKSYYWEIYCLKGSLFDDVERFKTKKLAEKRIKKLLYEKTVK